MEPPSPPIITTATSGFTAAKDGKKMYALYALPENDTLPATIEWRTNIPAKGSKVTLLQTGKSLRYKVNDDKVTVTLPKGLKNEPLAFAFSVK